jgi:hypothetical protein
MKTTKHVNEGVIIKGRKYSAKGTQLTPNSQGFKILSYINANGSASKYKCIIDVLGVKGSKKELRGYYSDYFNSYLVHGLLVLTRKNYQYRITSLGVKLLNEAKLR